MLSNTPPGGLKPNLPYIYAVSRECDSVLADVIDPVGRSISKISIF